jgi:hypothetical protein
MMFGEEYQNKNKKFERYIVGVEELIDQGKLLYEKLSS